MALYFSITNDELLVTNLLPTTNANLSVTSDMAVAVARYKRHTQPPVTDCSTAQQSTPLASTYCNFHFMHAANNFVTTSITLDTDSNGTAVTAQP